MTFSNERGQGIDASVGDFEITLSCGINPPHLGGEPTETREPIGADQAVIGRRNGGQPHAVGGRVVCCDLMLNLVHFPVLLL